MLKLACIFGAKIEVSVNISKDDWGYWHQRILCEYETYERFGDPPPRWIQEPSVVRNMDGKPPRGPSGSALLLYV